VWKEKLLFSCSAYLMSLRATHLMKMAVLQAERQALRDEYDKLAVLHYVVE
jgi:hypothetical protein